MSGSGNGSGLPIGQFDNSNLATHKLYTFQTNELKSLNVQPHEISLLKFLANENQTDFTEASVEDVSTALNNHIKIFSESNDSNIAMTIQHQHNTDVTYPLSDYNEKQNIEKLHAPNFLTKNVSLDDNTVSLYNANVKMEYSDGDANYTSDFGDHYVAFDTSDKDYNLHKAMNSVLSDTNGNTTNGIKGAFSYEFNSTNAFFTEKILVRNPIDNSITPTTSLDGKGISTSVGVPGDINWEKLKVDILQSQDTENCRPDPRYDKWCSEVAIWTACAGA